MGNLNLSQKNERSPVPERELSASTSYNKNACIQSITERHKTSFCIAVRPLYF